MPEGVGGAGWRSQRGKNQDNSNSIINKIKFLKKKPVRKRQTPHDFTHVESNEQTELTRKMETVS